MRSLYGVYAINPKAKTGEEVVGSVQVVAESEREAERKAIAALAGELDGLGVDELDWVIDVVGRGGEVRPKSKTQKVKVVTEDED